MNKATTSVHTLSSSTLGKKIISVYQSALHQQHIHFTPTELKFISDPFFNSTVWKTNTQSSFKLHVLYAPSLAKKPNLSNGDTNNETNHDNTIMKDNPSISSPHLKNNESLSLPPMTNLVKSKRNPFLPYDPTCFISDLSSTHVLLLNKYPVVNYHVLVVPKMYVSQHQPLEVSDFEHLVPVLKAFGQFIAFYNCGEPSGSSVDHRHIQVIPYPDPEPPLLPLFNQPEAASLLPFHFMAGSFSSLEAKELMSMYQRLLQSMSPLYMNAHNCLITSNCMVIIPRSKASLDLDACTLSLNALGYTGCMLVSSLTELHCIEQHGVIEVLTKLGVSKSMNK